MMDHPYDLVRENFTITGRGDDAVSTMPDLRYLNDEELMWHLARKCLRTLQAYDDAERLAESAPTLDRLSAVDARWADHECALHAYQEACPKAPDWEELLGYTGHE